MEQQRGAGETLLSQGQVLGDYEILALAGTGPNGVVYRARQLRTDRIVAIKVISPGLSADPEFRAHLVQESRTATLLGHPNIIPVYEVGGEGELLYVVMHYVEGVDLGHLLRQTGALDPRRLDRLLAQVASALDAAHAQGLVHRDMKPANVLVAEDDHVYVTDFGMAKRAADPDALTKAGRPAGTLDYTAPEQIAGHEVDGRSDVYALGVMLFELLSGQVPFVRDSDVSAAVAHLNDPPPSLEQLSPELADFDPVIQRALAKDPRDRFASARDLAQAAAAAAEGHTATHAEPVIAAAVEAPRSGAAADEANEQNVFDDDVQFTVYRPRRVQSGRWHTMLAFAHKSEPYLDEAAGPVDPLEEVRRQASSRLGEDVSSYGTASEDSAQPLPRGSALTFVPEADGVEFNPPSRTFRWVEPVHQEEFRMRAQSRLDGSRARGSLSVYLGSILIAEVSLSFRVSSVEGAPAPTTERARPYRRIFISYSHRDTEVVEQVEQVAMGYGDEFLRDVRDLRAGEHWDERICELIRDADIFQLFWSRNSMASTFVRREWTYALSLQRPYFIRPVFWEDPMPELPEQNLPPDELRRLQFRYLPGLIGAAAAATSTASAATATRAVPAPAASATDDSPTVLDAASPSFQAAPPPTAPPTGEAGPPLAAAAGPAGAAPTAAPRRSRLSSLFRHPALATLLIAIVIAGPLAAFGVSKLNGASSSATNSGASSAPPAASNTASESTTANRGTGNTGSSSSSGSSASVSPSCAGCGTLNPLRCAGCLAWQGTGSVDLGAVTGSLLLWTSSGGPFELILDGKVAVNSSAATGQIQLTQGRYADVRIMDPGAWSIKLY